MSENMFNASDCFLTLEEGTTSEELARHLQGILESEPAVLSLEQLVWEALVYYVPIAYKKSSGLHGDRPQHCNTLLDSLGHLLFNGDPKRGLAELKANSTPQQMCGRVFRSGETTYQCLDCGIDLTCVLCAECFKHSAHRNHRYQMTPSGGNGCCDCGDEEAWKSDPHCSMHPSAASSSQAETALDPALEASAKSVLGQCLRYCVTVLTWDDDDTTPDWCTGDDYRLLLYNDEVHTFEEIIKLLTHRSTLHVTKESAANLATIIDRDGRLPLPAKSQQECETLKQNLLAIQLHAAKPDVQVKIFPHSLVLHQIFAISLLTWLRELSLDCGPLQRIVHDLVLTAQLNTSDISDADDDDAPPPRIIDQMLSAGNILWKVSRSEFQSFLMGLMTSNVQQKVDFAIKFLEHYNVLQNHFMHDDHDHSMSMSSLSVQFFTVPTVAYAIMDEHDAFYRVTSLVWERLVMMKDAETGQLNLSDQGEDVDTSRSFFIIEDIRYLLSHPPVEWNEHRRDWFMSGFLNLVRVFREMEGMDAFKHKENEHVLYEKEWDDGFTLIIQFNSTLRCLLKWIRSDEEITMRCLDLIMEHICSQEDNIAFLDKAIKYRAEKQQKLIGGDVRKLQVSVHWPLRRLLVRIICGTKHLDIAKLFAKGMEHYGNGSPPPEEIEKYFPSVFSQCLLEHPLRCVLAAQQVLAGLWRRNGHSIYVLMMHYENVAYSMRDADLALCQISACALAPDMFVGTLLARLVCIVAGPKEPNLIAANVETFFSVLINILCERYDNRVSDQVTERHRVERELIHALFLGPMTHSEALKEGMSAPMHFASETGEKDRRLVDEMLKVVAERLQSNRGAQAAAFHLKEEYYSSCTPFFYHYTKAHQSKAHMRGRRIKDWVGLPVLPALSRKFVRVLSLLSSNVLLKFIANRLLCCITPQSEDWTEQMVHQIVYLLGMAIQEEQCYEKEVGGRIKSDFKWPIINRLLQKDMVKQMSIYELLQKLLESSRSDECKTLLRHVVEMLATHERSQLPPSATEELPISPIPERSGSTSEDTDKAAAAEKAKRKKKAAEQRAKAMDKMLKLQQSFLTTLSTPEGTSVDSTDGGTEAPMAGDGAAAGESVPMETSSGPGPIKLTCLLCQEEGEITKNGAVMIMVAYNSLSRVIGANQLMTTEAVRYYDPIACPSNLPLGINIHSCGHAMHSSCHAEWLDTKAQQHRSVMQGRFRCPMCNSVGNTAMPIFPRLTYRTPNQSSYSLLESLEAVRCAKALVTAHRAASETELSSFGSSSSRTPGSPGSGSGSGGVTLGQASDAVDSLAYVIGDRPAVTVGDQRIELTQKFAEFLTRRLDPRPVGQPAAETACVGASLAYGIMRLERILHSEGRSVFGPLSTRLDDPYQTLLTMAYEMRLVRLTKDKQEKLELSSSEMKLVSIVFALLEPSQQAASADALEVFHLEPFHLMVQLSLVLDFLSEVAKRLVASEDSSCKSDAAIVHLSTLSRTECCMMALRIALLVQTVHLLVAVTPEQLAEWQSEQSSEELPQPCLLTLWQDLRSRQLLHNCQALGDEVNTTEQCLTSYTQHALMPFLSRAALFLRFLGKPLPEVADELVSFSSLAKYLCIPETICDVVSELWTTQSKVVDSWLDKLAAAEVIDETPADKRSAKVPRKRSMIFVPGVRGLVQLPREYSDFFQQVAPLECPQAVHDNTLNKTMRNPAKCLLCGEFLCSMSYCCRKDPVYGNLTYHTKMCGGDVGVFLLIWDCKILVLSPPLGLLMRIPYLDEYGEPPSSSNGGGRTINPLFLDQTLFDELQSSWLRHAFIEKVWMFNDQQGHNLPNYWADM